MGAGSAGVTDLVANLFLMIFVSGKFYPLFSFLFGLGFGIMLLRASERGVSVVPIYLRRLAVLAAIGVAHSVLLWEGDILRLYAVLGVLLLLFRNRSPRFLLAAALAAFMVATFWGQYSPADPPPLSRPDPETQYVTALESMTANESLQEARQVLQWAQADGSYPELVAARAGMLIADLRTLLGLFNAQIFGMFLLGLYAARRRLFDDIGRHRRLALIVLVLGGILGLGANALLFLSAFGVAMRGMGQQLMQHLFSLGGPLLTLSYIAGITLLCQRARPARALAVLAPVGRMGLTNYLMHSVVGTTLYYGYTFGLHGRIGPAMGIALSIVIFACQIPISHWWMARFRFGPAEWVWRSLTYMQAQPMRREPVEHQPVLQPEPAATA
jgi:uncharacterized protein